MTIILYDINSTLADKIWNPNASKARLCLNFKGIPFTTEWIEHPNIGHCSQKIGPSPTAKKPDGSPLYTVPFNHDTSMGAAIADSILIAEYLEKPYPGIPKIFPNSTAGLQSTFNDVFLANLGTLLAVTYHKMMPYLNSAAVAYMAAIVERVRSKNRTEDWMKLKDDMSKIEGWYIRNGGIGSARSHPGPTSWSRAGSFLKGMHWERIVRIGKI
ncbi:hypothetical protein CVT25_008451 [Psilocybe cyanescens]|uniref:GST N-terminal domain-containing protein n=1 Tax=Psilocybe cyanescens TaxID=93625 RepID=A0A409WV29_PSICY|nr:hypothetical protein CVT25_008451 [Psilocybe cyanescens]